MKYLNFECPKCKSEKYMKEYEEDMLYVCAECKEPVAFYCEECEHMYENMNRLAFNGREYICKRCGKIQWGYTEWKNKTENVKK